MKLMEKTLMKFYIVIQVLSLLLVSTISRAQTPDWSVDLNSFEYSMTIACTLYYNDTLVSSDNDLVAAFVGEEVRGSAKLQFIPQTNQYIAYLLVKSNIVEGEELSFKIYDSTNDKIIEAVNQLSFKSNDAFGTTAEPYYIADTGNPLSISLSSLEVEERQPLSTFVGDLSSLDILGDTHTYRFVTGEGDTHNTLFRIEGSKIFTAAILNTGSLTELSIRVQSTNELGFTRTQIFTIKVLPTDNPEAAQLTSMSLSNLSIEENNLPNAVIGAFSTEGTFLSLQIYTYSLVPGEGSDDNADFTIEGQQLIAANPFNFEEQSTKRIRVLVTSQDGGVLEQSFEVQIVDVNEAPVFVESSISVEENTARGNIVGTINAEDPEGQPLFFSILDQPGENTSDVLFQIGSETGELTVNNSEFLDFESTTEILIEVRVEDAEGLFSVATIRIDIEDVIEQFLPVNNIVTPNNDGFNDTWEIRSINSYNDYSLAIYNAAGRQVYQTNQYQNDWAGTWEGKELPSGVFYYVFSSNTQGKTFKGAITLIR